MDVRIFWVCAMKCMCAQTRPRFILSSEGVFGGMEFEPMLTPREKSPLPKKSPEEDRTLDAVDSELKHYQLSYSGPPVLYLTFSPPLLFLEQWFFVSCLVGDHVLQPYIDVSKTRWSVACLLSGMGSCLFWSISLLLGGFSKTAPCRCSPGIHYLLFLCEVCGLSEVFKFCHFFIFFPCELA